MDLVIDRAFLPAILTAAPMTDDEFLSFCNEHPGLSFETTAQGELIVTPQTYSLTGARNSEITFQVHRWTRQDRRGVAFDSSTGFVTPDGARRSPDAAWVLKSRVAGLDPAHFGKFWRLCPDFVIELKSESDRLPRLQKKMREWIASGASLAWLLDPETRTVEIYRPGRETRRFSPIQPPSPAKGPWRDSSSNWRPCGIRFPEILILNMPRNQVALPDAECGGRMRVDDDQRGVAG